MTSCHSWTKLGPKGSSLSQTVDVRIASSSIGAVFDDEDEAVVFIPTSGEVVLCDAAAWRSLTEPRLLSARQSPSDIGLSSAQQSLLQALKQLGVNLGG